MKKEKKLFKEAIIDMNYTGEGYVYKLFIRNDDNVYRPVAVVDTYDEAYAVLVNKYSYAL